MGAPGPDDTTTPKIGVLRANGLGDLIVALPAIHALRTAYPAATITLFGTESHRALAPLLADIDEVRPVPDYPGVSADRHVVARPGPAYDDFRDRIREERYDLVLQMHGGGRYSNVLVGELGARTTAGFRTPDAPPLDLSLPYVFFQHEIMRYIELMGHLGIEPRDLSPRLRIAPAVRDEGRSLVSGDGPYVVLCPGNGGARRRWPVERFAAIARSCVSAGYGVVVAGAEWEADLCERLVELSGVDAAVVAGRASLAAIAAIMADSATVIASDGGLLHVGIASGAPTVGIWNLAGLAMFSPLSRERHRPLVSWTAQCPECGRAAVPAAQRWNGPQFGCRHEVSWTTDVGTDDVAHALDDLWLSLARRRDDHHAPHHPLPAARGTCGDTSVRAATNDQEPR